MRLLAIVLALTLSPLPAFAIEIVKPKMPQAEPNGGRGRKTLLETEPNGGKGIFDLPTLHDLVVVRAEPNGGSGIKLEKALEFYFSTIVVSAITDVGHSRLAELLTTRYPVAEILADIRASGVYADLDCRDEEGRLVEVQSRYTARGGDICLNLPLLAENLLHKTREEGLIHVAALALEGHLKHFQVDAYAQSHLRLAEQGDLDQKNRDEISLIKSYLSDTAQMTQYPLLRWTGAPNQLPAER